MPNVEEDLSEGLSLTESGGLLNLVRVFLCTDMEGVGAIEVLASALLLTSGGTAHTGADLPDDGDTIELNGKTLMVVSRTPKPWGAADAFVDVAYKEVDSEIIAAGIGPAQYELGVQAECGESDFDAANLALSFADRVPISVKWDPSSDVAPGGSVQGRPAKCPIYLPRAGDVYTRQQTTSPKALARLICGATNSTTFKGDAIGTVLCTGCTGRYDGTTGLYTVQFTFAYSEFGWTQVARAKDSSGDPVVPSNSQLAHENGIRELVMQKTYDFNGIGL